MFGLFIYPCISVDCGIDSCIVHHQVRSSILILIFNQGYKNVDKQSHPVSQVFRLSISINLSTSWQNALLILEAHQSVYAVAHMQYILRVHTLVHKKWKRYTMQQKTLSGFCSKYSKSPLYSNTFVITQGWFFSQNTCASKP